jgi:perosamine synthetase
MLRYLAPSGVPIRLSDIAAGLSCSLDGSAAERLRDEICRYFKVRHCFLVSSGRAGLSMIFQSLHRLRPERDEVVLPAFTSFSVPSAVVGAGLKVALYDLDGATLSPDIGSLRKSITDRTLCIVACHLFGYPCDMEPVLALAAEFGIPVVDDAAQAMGATYRGHLVGTLGYAGLFSLSRGKNISAVDGGIVVTDQSELARELEKLELERVGAGEGLMLAAKSLILSLLLHPLLYGIPARLAFLKIGASFFEPDFPLQRFTSFQAAIGSRMLRRLEGINDARRVKARLFMDKLGSRVRFPRVVPGAQPVYLRLPVLPGASKPRVIPELGIVKSYPAALNKIESARLCVVNDRPFKVADLLAAGLITLPTHGFVSPHDVSRIAAYTAPRESSDNAGPA